MASSRGFTRPCSTSSTASPARLGVSSPPPTTALPEWIGGARNWDYRFCWLRDATFTLYALLISGYTEEALSWREWLRRAVAGSPDDLQIMYGIAGERRLSELELPLGYEGSSPVLIGNAAHEKFQNLTCTAKSWTRPTSAAAVAPVRRKNHGIFGQH
jgi:GH15 family glucan-1,4-alpha-glucosidase